MRQGKAGHRQGFTGPGGAGQGIDPSLSGPCLLTLFGDAISPYIDGFGGAVHFPQSIFQIVQKICKQLFPGKIFIVFPIQIPKVQLSPCAADGTVQPVGVNQS